MAPYRSYRHDRPITANQLVTVLSDGATDLAGWTDRMNPTVEYVLDWFHIAMRFTVLANTMHGLQAVPEFDADPADLVKLQVELRRDIGRAKWHVWHGNIHDALDLLSYTMFGLEGCAHNDAQVKAVKLVDEIHGYLRRNQGSIPNYAERHRAGEPISSAAAEATVNSVIAKRMVKKQQMRWTPTGAHHLLQIRTRVLDERLDHDINRWNQQTAAAHQRGHPRGPTAAALASGLTQASASARPATRSATFTMHTKPADSSSSNVAPPSSSNVAFYISRCN